MDKTAEREELIQALSDCQHAYDQEACQALTEGRAPVGENAFYADYLLSDGWVKQKGEIASM